MKHPLTELRPLLSLGRKTAIDLTWELLLERPAMANISHSGMPTKSQHAYFVMNPPYVAWYVIIVKDAGVVGTIYLTQQNEIGVAILREFKRKGYAEAAILQLMKLHKPEHGIPGQRSKHFLANVSPSNKPSIALFNKLGKVIQWTYQL